MINHDIAKIEDFLEFFEALCANISETLPP